MQDAFDTSVTANRFSMPRLHTAVWSQFENLDEAGDALRTLKDRLSDREYKKLGHGILRQAFLVEPVLARGGATSVNVRWEPRLVAQQRGCSYDDCLLIATGLILSLADWMNEREEHDELLRLVLGYGHPSHALPADYRTRPEPDEEVSIHRPSNLGWTYTEAMVRAARLRKFLKEEREDEEVAFLARVVDKKVQIKSYLTDRAQTGDHQTNREKRWEAHPQSVQFAFRRDCMGIEFRLMEQICAFNGFPQDLRNQLHEDEVLDHVGDDFRCPITLMPISFDDFQDEVFNQVHGQSNFQVGHLNPLKLNDEGEPDEESGHVPANISWISADGNRIQGSLSLTDVRTLLTGIGNNYKAEGYL